MKKLIAIAIIVCVVIIFNDTVFAAPRPAEILEDTAKAYTVAKDWLEDLWFPILGFLAFVGVIAFWLKGS
ncbi:MAG: hypothetical protein F6K35_36280, partial [Okeania sp. SIO2H7]|nr:hypothetical protein [Okeania sp. SIO2H7]